MCLCRGRQCPIDKFVYRSHTFPKRPTIFLTHPLRHRFHPMPTFRSPLVMLMNHSGGYLNRLYHFVWIVVHPTDDRPILNYPNDRFQGLSANCRWHPSIDLDLDSLGTLLHQFWYCFVHIQSLWPTDRHCCGLLCQLWHRSLDRQLSRLDNRIAVTFWERRIEKIFNFRQSFFFVYSS